MSDALINRMFTLIDDREFDRLSEVFCENVVYERPGYEPLVGINALIHFYKEVRIIKSGEHNLSHSIEQTDKGVSWGVFVGESQDGRMLNVRFADCYLFTDGKVSRRETYFFQPDV